MKYLINKPNLSDLEKKYVLNALKTTWLSSNGYNTKIFERKFSKITKNKYSLAVQSGTAALHLALKSLGVKKGDNIIVPNYTCVSNLSSDQVISIFPNPTKEFIEVDAPSSYYHSDVVLYDMGGVEIYRWKSWKGELLNIENTNPGVYFLEFQGEEVIKKRVVKI